MRDLKIRICPDWNVKESVRILILIGVKIRICPDWNVKDLIWFLLCALFMIRICPDWNVKVLSNMSTISLSFTLEYVQIGM